MTVTLDKSHELKGNGYLLGVGGENESEQLVINVAYDVLLDKWAYIEFEQNGAKFTTERLTIENGQIVYTLTNSVLVQGLVDVQVVFRDASGFVWKSFKRQFLVSDEINATEGLPEQHQDFITEAQKLLDGITIQADKVDQVLTTEEARVAAEAQRAENEATRLANETERKTTEAERKTAETARVTAEEQRQINEAGRVDAETARRTEFSGWAVNFGNLNTYDKRLINLEEAGVGTLFDYVTDDTTAYSKTVPAKALPYARLNKVGGMTYKADNALIDVAVKSVKVVGKNLIPYPYYDTTKTLYGITFTDNGNGTITLNGTATDNAYFILQRNANYGSLMDAELKDYATNGTFTISKRLYYNATSKTLSLNVHKGMVFENEIVYPQAEFGTVATAYEPYEPYKANTYAIPEAIKALDGYGVGINDTCYNYINFNNKKFVKRVAVVDLGALSWSYIASRGYFRTVTLVDSIKASPDNGSSANLLCLAYEKTPFTNVYYNVERLGGAYDKVIAVQATPVDSYGGVAIIDKGYTDVETFKAAMSGVKLYYELATPIETDISAYITDNYIKVNGSIVFENDNGQAVPSEIIYAVKM